MAAAEISGASVGADHHALLEGDRWPWVISLSVFVLFWLMMVAAMMLPANLPVLAAYGRSAGGARSRRLTTRTFLTGYALVWAAFGAGAFAGDTAIHALVHHWHWLHEHEWIILAATLAIVGLFQLIPAKRRYLQRCRHQADYVTRHPGNTWSVTLSQGLRYGKCELACCWALMLLMVALGLDVAARRIDARGEVPDPRRAFCSGRRGDPGAVQHDRSSCRPLLMQLTGLGRSATCPLRL